MTHEEVSTERQIPIAMGMLGMSLEDISAGHKGYVKLPLGPRDLTMAGGRRWVKVKVTAMEDVRGFRDIIVGNDQGEIKEHTPVELSYEKRIGGYQRVSENYPLPIIGTTIYDDYAEIAFSATETEYLIGTNAKKADGAIPLFEAVSITFLSDQDCYIKFDSQRRVRHRLAAGDYWIYSRRTRAIYITRVTVDGTLTMWIEGIGAIS
jgi:hypothetical protein